MLRPWMVCHTPVALLYRPVIKAARVGEIARAATPVVHRGHGLVAERELGADALVAEGDADRDRLLVARQHRLRLGDVEVGDDAGIE